MIGASAGSTVYAPNFSASASYNLKLGTYNQPYVYMLGSTDGTYPNLKFGIGTATPVASLQVVGADSLSTSYAANISGATGTGLVVQNNGNVGIGTTSPSQILQVNGSALFGSSGNTTGTILFANSSNAYTTTLKASSTQASNLTFTLPPTNGSAGQVLSTDGAGVMSWISASTTGASLSANNTFTGLNTFSATSTLATTTINGTLTVNSIANCNSTQYLQITSGLFGCGTPAGGGGSSQWTVGSGFIRNATSTDAVEIGNGSSTPIAGSLVLSSAGTTTPSFTLLDKSGNPAIEMRDGGAAKQNTYIGYQAGLKQTTGSYNTVVGYGAGTKLSSGSDNILLGNTAGIGITIGGNNIILGYGAGNQNSNFGSDIVIGQNAAGQNLNSIAGNNIIIGYGAGESISSGTNSIFIGPFAGFQTSDSNTLLIDESSGRASATLEKQNSIIYGVMSSASTSQAITFNVATATVAGLLQQGFEKSCSTGLTTDSSGNINGCVVSDQRLKKEITPLTFDQNILDEINPITYYWKDTNKGTQQHQGFVAQQVKPFMPTAVVPAGNGYFGIDPNAMLAYLWKYMQTFVKQTDDFMTSTVLRLNGQDAKIAAQQKQIDTLQRQIDTLQRQVNLLLKLNVKP